MHSIPRGKDLRQLIKECLDIKNVSGDESLLSELRNTSILPIRAIIGHQWLCRLKLSEGDVISTCMKMKSDELKVIYCPEPCISLPYFVDVQVLVMTNIPDTKQSEFRAFLESIVGHNYFELHPNGMRSFRTRFADDDTALCVFSALKYCVFKGQLVTVTPMTSSAPIPEKSPLCPILVHKKRNQQRKEKKLRDQVKKPAEMSLTTKLSENARIPNAYSRSNIWKR